MRALPYRSTSFTTAAYGSHQNVFIRLDPLGRPPSANSGSYATIASLNKYSLSDSKKSCTYTVIAITHGPPNNRPTMNSTAYARRV